MTNILSVFFLIIYDYEMHFCFLVVDLWKYFCDCVLL